MGRRVKAAAAPRPGDETVVLAAAKPAEAISPLAARLREIAKDKDAIRALMASLRER